MHRRTFLLGTAALSMLPDHSFADAIRATLYKDPQCGCCAGYADYLRKNGFAIEVIETDTFAEIGRRAGVPEDLEGCHTLLIDPYVVSGHVPVEVISKLLVEQPAVAGITLPGMPVGSPGMGGTKTETFTIYSFTSDGKAPMIYAAV